MNAELDNPIAFIRYTCFFVFKLCFREDVSGKWVDVFIFELLFKKFSDEQNCPDDLKLDETSHRKK